MRAALLLEVQQLAQVIQVGEPALAVAEAARFR